jgi:hypothetical protein
MQRVKRIKARDRAFWSSLMILILALIPRCVAQTDKSGARAKVKPAPTQASFEGCYELNLGWWWPWGFGEENAYVTPPPHIQLLGEHGTRGFEQDELLIRTIPRQDRMPGSRESSFWIAKSQNQLC